MDIIIHEENIYNWKPIFTSEDPRNPTMTDVKFISDTILVAANRQSAKLYLIEKLESSFSILFTLDTVFEGVSYHTDLFDVTPDGTLYTTNYTNTACVYTIKDKQIEFQKIIKLHPSNRYHGVQIHGNNVFFTPAIGVSSIAIYNIPTNIINHKMPERIGTNRIKDICFLENNFVILLLTTDTPTDTPKDYDAYIALYRFAGGIFRYIQKISFKNTHLDSVISKNNILYATSHSPEKAGLLLKCDVKDAILRLIQRIPCESFPHGIDINKSKNLLAYTSYTSSGIHFMNI